MEFSENNVHLFFQLYLRIKNDIILGELPPGDRLPNIEELHRLYNVSHGTVRRALELLSNEGLVTKKRGAGTFTRDDVDLAALFSGPSLADVGIALQASCYTLVSKNWVVPPKRVQAVFGDPNEDYRKGQVLHLKKHVEATDDQRRRAVADIYLPAWIAKELDAATIRNRSIYAAVIGRPDLGAEKLKQIVRPWVCDSESGKFLKLLPGTPVFHRTWLLISRAKRTLVYSEALITARSLIREIDLSQTGSPDAGGS